MEVAFWPPKRLNSDAFDPIKNPENGGNNSMRKNHGPQGTQVFSRDEVDRLLDQARGEEETSKGARIRGLNHSVSGEVFSLPPEGAMIGRARTCAIRIDDASVSSEHARLVPDENGWRLVNLLSTNGTFVNAAKITSAPLRDGDHISFGRVEFQFQDSRAENASGRATPGWRTWLVLAVIGLAAVAGMAFWLL